MGSNIAIQPPLAGWSSQVGSYEASLARSGVETTTAVYAVPLAQGVFPTGDG